MSNHRPRTDPGPPIPTIVASALLTLAIATVSAWIILGNGPTDARHIVGFLLGNTLAVVTFGQTVMWASERATAQSRIRRFKELEECQDNARAYQRSWDRSEKAFMGSRLPGHTGQASVPPDTYRVVQEEIAWPEPWMTSHTGQTTDAAQTQALVPDAVETQVLLTGDATQTQPLTTSDAAQTQALVTDEAQTHAARIIAAAHETSYVEQRTHPTGRPRPDTEPWVTAQTQVLVTGDQAAAAETQVIPTIDAAGGAR